MFRTILGPAPCLPLLALAALGAVPASPAQADDREAEVKVSLSWEDPNVRVGEWESDGVLDFYIFLDGLKTRGGEFGLTIDGADFRSFAIDTEQSWLTMPMKNPYPGTIAQVLVGPDCSEPPTLIGVLTVTPREPGGKVVVDVIPSMRAADATVLDCENLPLNVIRGFPATVNGTGTPARAHRVIGENTTNMPVTPTGEAAVQSEEASDERADEYGEEDR